MGPGGGPESAPLSGVATSHAGTIRVSRGHREEPGAAGRGSGKAGSESPADPTLATICGPTAAFETSIAELFAARKCDLSTDPVTAADPLTVGRELLVSWRSTHHLCPAGPPAGTSQSSGGVARVTQTGSPTSKRVDFAKSAKPAKVHLAGLSPVFARDRRALPRLPSSS